MRKISALLLLAMAGCATSVPTFREFVRETNSPNNYEYPVTVNYNVTVDSLIKDGQHSGDYFLLNPNINSKNFSLTVNGEKKITIQLAHFDKQPMTHWEILEALRKQHLRPANAQEFLCFVQKYSWKLRKFNAGLDLLGENQIEVICLGASYRPENSFYSQVLRSKFSDYVIDIPKMPVIDLTCLELNWLLESYFAVVSTDSPEEDAEIKPKTIEFKNSSR